MSIFESKMQQKLQNPLSCGKRAVIIRIECNASLRDLHIFYGEISGKIIRERRGSSGFGYDSVFVPEGYEETFAEMGEEEKNKISHRARAVKKLSDFFNTL